jgi:hypothetical protein
MFYGQLKIANHLHGSAEHDPITEAIMHYAKQTLKPLVTPQVNTQANKTKKTPALFTLPKKRK